MTAPSTQVTSLLTQFGLTTAAEELVPRLTQAGHPEALPVLVEVFEAEAEARRQRRVTRLRRASRLPPGKTFATLDAGRLPAPVAQRLETLATGAFLETATNVLAFGLPGVGKSHALCAVGHALVEAGPSPATEKRRDLSEPIPDVTQTRRCTHAVASPSPPRNGSCSAPAHAARSASQPPPRAPPRRVVVRRGVHARAGKRPPRTPLRSPPRPAGPDSTAGCTAAGRLKAPRSRPPERRPPRRWSSCTDRLRLEFPDSPPIPRRRPTAPPPQRDRLLFRTARRTPAFHIDR